MKLAEGKNEVICVEADKLKEEDRTVEAKFKEVEQENAKGGVCFLAE